MTVALHPVDIAIIVASLLSLFIGLGFSVWKNKSNLTANDFFLSGRDMSWWLVGASLFASNIGSEHFVGQAGTAAASGIAVGLYEWTATFLLVLLGWVFVPIYLRRELTTVPEWFERRFSPSTRLLLSVMSIMMYVITKISATIYSGAIFIQVLLGWNLTLSIVAIIICTGLYTIVGGLTAVMYTDAVQMFVFMTGGLFGMGFAMKSIGGFSGMQSIAAQANLTDFLNTIRPIDAAEFSPIGLFVGQIIASTWYWCVDQEMVQRILAAKDENHAKGGTLLSGFCKLIPVFMIVFPGMTARLLYEKCILDPEGGINPAWCNTNLSSTDQSNKAYPYLIIYEFPIGVVGLISSSLLAAMMSSLCSVFNSASTIFTVDLYQRFIRPDASDKEMVMVGRISTVAMTLLGIAWIPVIQAQQGQLFLVSQNVMTHVAPTLTTVFLLGVFWHRINGQGALIGMVTGVFLGLSRLVAFLVITSFGECSLKGPLWVICSDFNLFAILLAAIVAIITSISSLLTEPTNKSEVYKNIYHYPKWCCGYCLNEGEELILTDHEQQTEKPTTENQNQFTRLMETPISGEINSTGVALDDEMPTDRGYSQPDQTPLQVIPESDSTLQNTILNALAILLMITTVSFITGFSGAFY